MSLVRQALGLEQRAATLDSIATYGDPTLGSGFIPDGYGQPGAGSWDTGMRWDNSGAPNYSAAPESAMRLSAVFGCLRLLSEPIAMSPIDHVELTGSERRPTAAPAYLTFNPPGMSRTEYLSQLMLSMLTDGNAFVGTPRDVTGQVTQLIPLDPRRVSVERYARGHPRAGMIFYRVDGNQLELGPLDIMHIKGMCMPGALRGISPIAMAREVIGSAGDAQTYGANMFRNGAVPPAVLEVPGAGGTPAEENERARSIGQTWNETNGGTARAGKVGVLLGGAKLTTVAISPEDMQWLDSRRFGIQEVARFYGAPPHLLADASNSTSWGSGLAEQNTMFGQLALGPWVTRIEEGHDRLAYTVGRGNTRTVLNLDAKLKATPEDRWQVHAISLSTGARTINEVRAEEGYAAVPWGNEPRENTPMPVPRPKPAT